MRKIATILFTTLFLSSTLFGTLAEAASYNVEKGDNLYTIGKGFGVSWSEIMKANNLPNTVIHPGQTLTIPEGKAKSSPNVNANSQTPNSADLELLAKAIHGEARGESYEGKVAVAAVILNRVESPLFPNTISEVIYQPRAFTAVNDGQINLTPNAEAYKAAKEALNGSDPSGGAIFYYNPAKSTSKWIFSRQVIKTIDQHVFAV